jgi:hypothetical protein
MSMDVIGIFLNISSSNDYTQNFDEISPGANWLGAQHLDQLMLHLLL